MPLDAQLCTIAETTAANIERGALMIQFVIVSLLALHFIPSSALAQICAANPVAVQILGSGGPRVNRDRASSSYLLWIDAQARILVDMGGGAFLRFGQAQAKLSDLSLVAISHLHPDHDSDVPRANTGCVDSIQLRSDRKQPKVHRVREGNECPGHASCHCRGCK